MLAFCTEGTLSAAAKLLPKIHLNASCCICIILQCILLTLDLYHSSASWRFLAATLSYCWRTSRRAAVRSGLETSISIWMCCSWSWACSSRISLERSRHSELINNTMQKMHRLGLGARTRVYLFTWLTVPRHRPHHSAYLIMKLLQEDNLFLQGLNFALKIKACQRGIVNILIRKKRTISNLIFATSYPSLRDHCMLLYHNFVNYAAFESVIFATILLTMNKSTHHGGYKSCSNLEMYA